MSDSEGAMQNAPKVREDAVVQLLRENPAFAGEYLTAALEQADPANGAAALVSALRHVAEAHGMYSVAQCAGIPREGLYRALAPGGEPSIQVLLAVLHAAGLKLTLRKRTA